MSSSSDDDTPLGSIPNGFANHTLQNGNGAYMNKNGKRRFDESSDLSDDEQPLVGLTTP
jgi:hypothetical protein